MRYQIEPTNHPLYGGNCITISLLKESLDKDTATANGDDVGSSSKLGTIKSLTKQKSFMCSTAFNNMATNIDNITINRSLDETQMTANVKLDLSSKAGESLPISYISEETGGDDEDNSNCRYFLTFEGSSVVHVVSCQSVSNNTLISVIPQHNKEESVAISLYVACRNSKAQKHNESYRKISKLPHQETFNYVNDDVTSIANDVVENLHDVKKCYQILSTFIDAKLAAVGNHPDCKLNIENRLHYLIRFHIDVQYSLGFLVVLNPGEVNMKEFDRQKFVMLDYLRRSEFYVLLKLFNKVYTIGTNNQLDMRVEILPNEPSFLYFSSSDNRDNNFIREYTNGLVSHTTCKENNCLNFNNKICVITNIFLLPPFSHSPRANNGAIENHFTTGPPNDSCSPELDETSLYSELARLDMEDDPSRSNTNSTSFQTSNTNLPGQIAPMSAVDERALLSVSTSLNQLSNNELDQANIQYALDHAVYKDSEISEIDKNRGYVTIKPAHLSVRNDPSLQVDKSTIQKFFSTKYTKAEADIAHERYRKSATNVTSHEGMGGNSSCRSNKFLKDFLSQNCSTSVGSNEMYSQNLSTGRSETNKTSKSLTHLNQPYLQVTTDHQPHANDSSQVFNLRSGVNCRSSIICNGPAEEDDNDTPSSKLVACNSYALPSVKKKAKFKTQNIISNKLKNKSRHSTFGHNEQVPGPSNHETENVNIREFLDKEITHLDNDTSFKTTVQLKAQAKKSAKIHLGLNIFKKDKVYSDITPNFRESKPKLKTKHLTHHADRNTASKQSRLNVIKTMNNSSDLVFTSQDNFNRSINCLFANNEVDLQTEENSSALFKADTWSSTAEQKIIKKLGPKETKRQDVIYELIYTENQYIRTLKTLHHVMYKGLQNFVMISTTTVDKLMPNLASLIAINGRFLADLRARQNADENFIVHTVSDIFMSQFAGSVGDYMAEIYAQVCLQKHSAVNLYKDLMAKNSDFNLFVTACANRPQLKRLTIPEVIAFITQRPLKYPLLIQEILKCTKDDTPEKENLTKALDNAKNVIKQMNSYVTEYENAAALDQIRKKLDPKLEWNYNDSLLKIDDIFPESVKLIQSQPVVFKTKQRCFDVILVALRSHFVFLVEKDQKYTLLSGSENPPIIPMQNLLLRTVATDKKAFFLVDKYHAYMYEIVCTNVMEKSSWVDKINRHLKENSADIRFTYKKNNNKPPPKP